MTEMMEIPADESAEREMKMMALTMRRLEVSAALAERMFASSMLPTHFTAKKVQGVWEQLPPEQIKANCILAINQALRWNVDPFAILPSTFCIDNKLGFDGKLITAVVNDSGRLKGSLDFKCSGPHGDDRMVLVSGTLKTETEPRTRHSYGWKR